jgi:1,4-dihydroxy-6-naphthoate synthase
MPLVKARIRAGYSPEPDQAFLFYAIACDKIRTDGIKFLRVMEEAEALNRRSLKAELEVSMLSTLAFFRVAKRYAIVPCGLRADFNEGMTLAAREPVYPKDLRGKKIAFPGLGSTAYALLKLFLNDFKAVPMSDKAILGAVRSGEVDAGVLTGRAEIEYETAGLKKIASLGEWFHERTGLPVPTDVLAIRKNLGRDIMRKVTKLLRNSIEYGLSRHAEAVDYASVCWEGFSKEALEHFLSRQVSADDLEISRKTKEGLWALQKAVAGAGLVHNPSAIEFVEM